jgi:hypothetical protein
VQTNEDKTQEMFQKAGRLLSVVVNDCEAVVEVAMAMVPVSVCVVDVRVGVIMAVTKWRWQWRTSRLQWSEHDAVDKWNAKSDRLSTVLMNTTKSGVLNTLLLGHNASSAVCVRCTVDFNRRFANLAFGRPKPPPTPNQAGAVG